MEDLLRLCRMLGHNQNRKAAVIYSQIRLNNLCISARYYFEDLKIDAFQKYALMRWRSIVSGLGGGVYL